MLVIFSRNFADNPQFGDFSKHNRDLPSKETAKQANQAKCHSH